MTKSRGINRPKHKWTQADIDDLMRCYPREKSESIANRIGCTTSVIYNMAHKLGLQKSPEFMTSRDSGRMQKGDTRGAATRFYSTQTAWNVGLSYTPKGRASESWFKPGHRPHTWRPIGSYRVAGGVLQKKISEASGPNNKRWRSVHELVWIEANGIVPKGHLVVFKPGFRTIVAEEITLDRIECITLAENMRRNTVHRMPAELREVIHLKATVVRKINQRNRNEKQHRDTADAPV